MAEKPVVTPTHPYRSLEEKYRRDQEWADRYYNCQWDWSKPARKKAREAEHNGGSKITK